jgi:hypothetical protein
MLGIIFSVPFVYFLSVFLFAYVGSLINGESGRACVHRYWGFLLWQYLRLVNSSTRWTMRRLLENQHRNVLESEFNRQIEYITTDQIKLRLYELANNRGGWKESVDAVDLFDDIRRAAEYFGHEVGTMTSYLRRR